LFVILWVLKPNGAPSPQNPQVTEQEDRLVETIGEIRAGFGYVPDPMSTDPVDRAMIRKRIRMAGPGEEGTTKVKPDGAEGTDPEVTNIRESKLAAVGGKALFQPGEATLTAEHMAVLNDIADKIRGTRFIVIVKGHASRDDFADRASPQKFMDISIRRAQAAADYLTSRNVSPDILRVQGCSYFEPIQQQAYTPEAQLTNRRAEVFSTDLTVRDLQDPRHAAQSPVN
jgi:outer membrane protein OmpA-like peptidoglycan-associated protein